MIKCWRCSRSDEKSKQFVARRRRVYKSLFNTPQSCCFPFTTITHKQSNSGSSWERPVRLSHYRTTERIFHDLTHTIINTQGRDLYAALSAVETRNARRTNDAASSEREPTEDGCVTSVVQATTYDSNALPHSHTQTAIMTSFSLSESSAGQTK